MRHYRVHREGFEVFAVVRQPKGLNLFPIVFVLVGLAIASPRLLATGTPQDASNSDLSSSFRCPEDYPSSEAKQAALKEFMRAYAAKFPDNNVRDLMVYRYRLLVAHSCIQALQSMLADVSPFSEMLSLQNRDYGPKTEEFDPATKVWTIYFRKDGEPPALSDQGLIFNFYGWKPATSPEAIAQAFVSRRDNVQILGKFQAPDDVTKAPAYFIVSETVYPGQTFGYVNISKITSVGSGAYTVTFSKKIAGSTSADAAEKGKAWFLSDEGQKISHAIDRVGVDTAWEEYLSKAPRK
jgi:hypothetical protein